MKISGNRDRVDLSVTKEQAEYLLYVIGQAEEDALAGNGSLWKSDAEEDVFLGDEIKSLIGNALRGGLIEESNLKEVAVLSCKHVTKHGTDAFASIHPDYESALAHVETVMGNCDYDGDNPERGEFFEYDIDCQVIDISKCKAASKGIETKEKAEAKEGNKISIDNLIANATEIHANRSGNSMQRETAKTEIIGRE